MSMINTVSISIKFSTPENDLHDQLLNYLNDINDVSLNEDNWQFITKSSGEVFAHIDLQGEITHDEVVHLLTWLIHGRYVTKLHCRCLHEYKHSPNYNLWIIVEDFEYEPSIGRLSARYINEKTAREIKEYVIDMPRYEACEVLHAIWHTVTHWSVTHTTDIYLGVPNHCHSTTDV